LSVAAIRAARRWGGARELIVLDAQPRGLVGRLLRAAAHAAGFRVREAVFFAGRLHTLSGESVYRAARRRTGPVAFDSAAAILSSSSVLAAVAGTCRPGVIRLVLARRIWGPLEELVRRVLVVAALEEWRGNPRVVLHRSRHVPDAAVVAAAGSHVEVRFCGRTREVLYAKLSALQGAAMLLLRIGRTLLPRSSGRLPEVGGPGLLELQADDLGLVDDVRAQPHWVLHGSGRPWFRTYIWPTQAQRRVPGDGDALARAGVVVLTDEWIRQMERNALRDRTARGLLQDAGRCVSAALASVDAVEASACAGIGKLLVQAALAAVICDALHIRVFLTGENYLLNADAMQVVAPRLGVTTVSYQYSNISLVSPSIMTSADVMVLFSPAYETNWTYEDVRPRQFVAGGYPFDYAFATVRRRAQAHRERLEAAGARFVVAYFDESLQRDRYGVVHAEDHRAELDALARMVLADPTVGVLVKTQFAANTPSRAHPDDAELRAAIQTGRFIEVSGGGMLRNNAFPSEAALAADIAVAQVIGGTAALEAALAGRRCLMIDACGWPGTWDDVYRRADILRPSIEAALASIQAWRAGNAPTVGDWSPILGFFDGYRDGRAAVRLRALLERLMSAPEAAPHDSAATPVAVTTNV
jgi:hypothetical protein